MTARSATASRRSVRRAPANACARSGGERRRPRKPPDRRRRVRRTITTTKPPLAQRFGAGRPRRRLIATLVGILVVLAIVLGTRGVAAGEQRRRPAQRRRRAVGADPGAAGPAGRDLRPQRRRARPVGAGGDGRRQPASRSPTPPAPPRCSPSCSISTPTTRPRWPPPSPATPPSTSASATSPARSTRRSPDQIDALDMTGVSTYSEDRRMLPGGSTGRSVIGRTDIDGIGIAGLEMQYNDLLQGSPGRETLEVAPGGRSIAGTEQTIDAAVAGRRHRHSPSTARCSTPPSRRCCDASTRSGPRAASIVVMSVDGDILAMASVDRNDERCLRVVTSRQLLRRRRLRAGLGRQDHHRGRGARTTAPSRPTRYFTVPWQYDCTNDTSNGILSDSHQHDVEQLSVHDILVESSNIGTIMVQDDGARRTHATTTTARRSASARRPRSTSRASRRAS